MRVMALLLFCISCASTAASLKKCDQPKLEDVAEDHPECLFYTGTAAFRAEKYQQALIAWSRLAEMEDVAIQYQYLRTDAMNNLGYLHHAALGTPQAVNRAIELWQAAFTRGHEEAAYHLCHTYADPKEPEYSPELGRGYCTEALRRYRALRESDRENSRVIAFIQKYIEALPQ